MADLSALAASDSTKISGASAAGAETNYVDVSPNQEIYANDTARISGVEGSVSLSTTAVEAKVGSTRLTNRKYITLQGVSQNTRFGLTTACLFTLYPNQTVILPFAVPVYVRVTTGTGSVIVGECS